MERRNQLKTKQWGYQTCCPDEENTCGYYEPVDRYHLQLYEEPSLDAKRVTVGQVWSCWGWDIHKDKEAKLTWVKISRTNDVWAVHDTYFSITDDDEEEEEEEEEAESKAWKRAGKRGMAYVLTNPQKKTYASLLLTNLVKKYNLLLPNPVHHLRYNGCLYAISSKCKSNMYKQCIVKKVRIMEVPSDAHWFAESY